jgi:predicted Holliday junction resolvase-like endonuclease
MIEIIGLIILLLVMWVVLPNTIDEWFQRRDNLRKKQLRQSSELDEPLVTDRELKEELWKLEELIESGHR